MREGPFGPVPTIAPRRPFGRPLPPARDARCGRWHAQCSRPRMLRSLLAQNAGALSLTVALLGVAALSACRHGKGPSLHLVSPAGTGPSFGDAPNRSAESMRAGPAGGGGGASASAGDPGDGASPAVDAARIAGAAAGIGAGAFMVATGAMTCKPGMDTLDAGALVNVCSGEARAPMLGPSPAP